MKLCSLKSLLLALLLMLVFSLCAFAGTWQEAPDSTSPDSTPPDSAVANATHGSPSSGRSCIGIARVTSSVGQAGLTQPLQEELIKDLASLKVEAVPLTSNPDDHDAIEAEAQQKRCEYFVLSDIASLKRFGGSRKTTSPGHTVISGARTAAEVSVKAYLPGQMRPVLDGGNNYKGGDVKSTLKSLMEIEAKSIATEILKVKR